MEEELIRAKKILCNSHYFSLETPYQIASTTGYNCLWNRNQNLLKPLDYINNWTRSELQEEVFSIFVSNNKFKLGCSCSN